MMGKIESKRERGWQTMRWLDSITVNGNECEQTPGELRTEKPSVLQSMGSQKVSHDVATEQKQHT